MHSEMVFIILGMTIKKRRRREEEKEKEAEAVVPLVQQKTSALRMCRT